MPSSMLISFIVSYIMLVCFQRQVRYLAGRRPVPGAHAALHHVRQRATGDARGLHREDNGVLDLHLSASALATRPPHRARAPTLYSQKLSFRLSYEICYEDLTLLQVNIFDFSTDESENFVLYDSDATRRGLTPSAAPSEAHL